MKKVFILIGVGIAMGCIMLSCAPKKNLGTVVAVSNKVAVKAEPKKDGTYITSLARWEQVVWLGDSAIDNEKRVYYKVQLSDGKIGWAGAYGSVVNGTVSVVKDSSALYLRPDITTATKTVLPSLLIVVASTTKDRFVNIIGQDRKLSGWLFSEIITSNPADVQAAIVTEQTLETSGNQVSEQMINEIASKLGGPNSFVIQKLRERIAGTQTGAAIDSAQAAQVPQTESSSDMTE